MISHYINLWQERKIEHLEYISESPEDTKRVKHMLIIETVREKFRPILMCGFVAALGLLPASLAQGVGSQVQKPLAIVVVGGMLVGTALIFTIYSTTPRIC